MITPNVPPHATRIEYTASRHTGVIYVWRKGTSYYWDALGNNGETSSEDAAMQAAKRWIRGDK